MRIIRILAVCLLMGLATGCNLSTTPPTPTLEPPTPAPSLTCDQLIEIALSQTQAVCDAVGRNQVCYGHDSVQAIPQESASIQFVQQGDLAPLDDIRSITTAALDTASETWGIALLKAQSNLPDTLPGQNVTLLLFGNAQLDDVSTDMRAIVLRTGVGQTACENAPADALLIQSPTGNPIVLSINGAEVSLGSTIFVTAYANNQLRLATLEGQATVASGGQSQIILPGTQVRIPLGGSTGLEVIGAPSAPEPFDSDVISRSPIQLLERSITIPPAVLPSTATVPTAPPINPPVTTAACTPRQDWQARYTIQAGDTLFSIAQRAAISLDELQRGNCINDPNQIRAGDSLRIPRAIVSSTNTPIVVVSPTAIRFDPNLRADTTTIRLGECTTIRWETAAGRQILFQGQPTRTNSQQVCPTTDSSYTLLVTDSATGQQQSYTVRVQVILPQPTDTPQPIT
jgi:LysM repeat protein